MSVESYQFSFCDGSYELNLLVRILICHFGEGVDECLLPLGDRGVVLA